jgi:hypothetical protein
MRNLFKKIYEFTETIPDYLYPFACEIEGRWVRGRKSYLQALNHAFDTYGPHRLGYKLTVYRAGFHFLGAVLFIIFSAIVSKKLLGSEIALYILLVAAIVALFIQEFHSHPKRYGQSKQKGWLDWLTWTIPMLVYISMQVI